MEKGKSTLLKILATLYTADSGTIKVGARAKFYSLFSNPA